MREKLCELNRITYSNDADRLDYLKSNDLDSKISDLSSLLQTLNDRNFKKNDFKVFHHKKIK